MNLQYCGELGFSLNCCDTQHALIATQQILRHRNVPGKVTLVFTGTQCIAVSSHRVRTLKSSSKCEVPRSRELRRILVGQSACCRTAEETFITRCSCELHKGAWQVYTILFRYPFRCKYDHWWEEMGARIPPKGCVFGVFGKYGANLHLHTSFDDICSNEMLLTCAEQPKVVFTFFSQCSQHGISIPSEHATSTTIVERTLIAIQMDIAQTDARLVQQKMRNWETILFNVWQRKRLPTARYTTGETNAPISPLWENWLTIYWWIRLCRSEPTIDNRATLKCGKIVAQFYKFYKCGGGLPLRPGDERARPWKNGLISQSTSNS